MNLPSSRAPVRCTAHQREERRIRIMGMTRSGFSYEAIARECQVTRERIRQIVVASLHTEKSGSRVDRMRVQMARLEPALRLAARGVENGKLGAIGPLLQVLDDRFRGTAQMCQLTINGALSRTGGSENGRRKGAKKNGSQTLEIARNRESGNCAPPRFQ